MCIRDRIIDVILPTTTYLESEEHFINCFNILQKTQGLCTKFKKVKEDWKSLLLFLNKSLYLNLKLFKNKDLFKQFNLEIGSKKLNLKTKFHFKFKTKNKFYNKLFISSLNQNVVNYYLCNSFEKSSNLMEKSSKSFFKNKYIYIWN